MHRCQLAFPAEIQIAFIGTCFRPDSNTPDHFQIELPVANIALRVPGFLAAAMVAKYTDAVATLPSRVGTMLAGELGLQLIRPPLPLPQVPIGLYWHERSHRDPANKWLRALFQRLFADSARNHTVL